MDMKFIKYSHKESSYRLINNIGITILSFGILFSIIGALLGFALFTESDTGAYLIGASIGLFLWALLCFGICKGISELVFRSYLRFRLDQHKMNDEDLFYEVKK